MSTRVAGAILGLLLACGSSSADDTFVTLGAGGLVPVTSTEIVMESEDLQVTVHRITVRYVFRNSTPKDIEGVVAFPLPDLNGEMLYFNPVNLPDETKLNFVNFRVTVDGKPVAPLIESRAFLKDQDVTARLRAAGVPVTVMSEPLSSALAKISPAVRQQLERERFIEQTDFNPPLHSTGKTGWWAYWTMRVRFYWTQRFPANKTVVVSHTYQPVVGGSYIGPGWDTSSSVEPYCGGAQALRQIQDIMRPHMARNDDPFLLYERRIDFILKTANNWSGPIRNFHLTVLSDSPEDIVMTCTSPLQRIAPTRYEFSQANYRPDSDLKLMILQAHPPSDHPPY